MLKILGPRIVSFVEMELGTTHYRGLRGRDLDLAFLSLKIKSDYTDLPNLVSTHFVL